jgi:predicted anti-sigma-YlaC factor YlaD
MKCGDLYRLISHHAEGVLEADDCAAIERHLQECSSCGELRRDLEDLARLCRDSDRPRMPEDVRRRIEAMLQDASATR